MYNNLQSITTTEGIRLRIDPCGHGDLRRYNSNTYRQTDSYIHNDALVDYKKNALKTSKQLGYDPTVRDKIRKATNVAQIQQIMISARNSQL
jgi:hypothetical protein